MPLRILVPCAVLLAVAYLAGAAAWPSEVDEGNLGLALWSFDPRAHRPQPPGYLFHVLLGRGLLSLFETPHRALVVQSALTGAVALFPLFALARRLLPRPVALCVALTATTSPIALYMGGAALTGIDALVLAPACLVLLLRARQGERRALLLGSCLVGIAGGFRPDVTLFGVLPWLLAMAPHDGRARAAAVAALTAGVSAWLLPTILVCDGIGPYREACAYVNDILRTEAPLFGGSWERAAATGWRIAWGLLLTAGPTVTLALLLLPLKRRTVARVIPDAARPLLYAAALPPLALWILTFFHKKAYLFPALPALLVLGAAVLLGSSRSSRRAVLALLTGLLTGPLLWLALPSGESLYHTPAGFGRMHRDLPVLQRVLWQPLERTLATRHARDLRVAALVDLVSRERALGRTVTVVTHPPDPLHLRTVCLALPDVPVLELIGRPGAWIEVGAALGIAAHPAGVADDGRVPVETDRIVVCTGWDRNWAESLAARGAVLVRIAPLQVFAILDGPARL